MAATSGAPSDGDSLVAAAVKVLVAGNPWQKAAFTRQAAELWQTGRICEVSRSHDPPCPEHPTRDCSELGMRVVAPGEMPKLGKGGTLASRQAILHSLAHIESWAVDLSWDIIARFGREPSYHLPRSFFDDWVQVAEDEGRHFTLLAARLEATGSHYGAMPVHDGLWESASQTAYSLAARLSVEHCVHEARGLDVLPQTISRMRNGGDTESAELLQNTIYKEEITHCAAGVRWLKHLYGISTQSAASDVAPEWMQEAASQQSVELWFHSLMRRNFKGVLKPPFNEEARAKAGFGPEWYMPLTHREDGGINAEAK